MAAYPDQLLEGDVMRVGVVVVSSLLLTGTLGACSSESDDMVGGMTDCTFEAVGEAAEQYAESLGDGNEYGVDNLECADGWAVTSGILGDGSGQGAPTSFIFEAEGQFWVPRSQEDVCGTYEDGSYPTDATIPEELYEIGCLT
jgi:hypothetical protein